MRWVFASSLVRVLALSHAACRHLLREAWGPTGSHEVECNCVCGECQGPAQWGHAPPCTTPPPLPPDYFPPPPPMPPPATPPPPPALPRLEEIPTLDWAHLPTLGPIPSGNVAQVRAAPAPLPHDGKYFSTSLLSVRAAPAPPPASLVPPSGRLRLCAALLQVPLKETTAGAPPLAFLQQLPPPAAECQCECPPCNLRAPGPSYCDPMRVPTTTTTTSTPAPPPTTPGPKPSKPAQIPPMAPLPKLPEFGADALPPLSSFLALEPGFFWNHSSFF